MNRPVPAVSPGPPVTNDTLTGLSTTSGSLHDAEKSNLARLHKAEREISLCRWTGMAFWLAILLWRDFAFGLNEVWLVYFSSVAFTAFAQWRLRQPDAARSNAWITMVGDPILCAGICAVTGGLESVLIPFLYLSSLASGFRFGLREMLAILGLNYLLSILLYLYATGTNATPDLLFIALFYNSFAAALGALFAGWARNNLALAQAQSRALQHAHTTSRSLLHRLIDIQEVERKHMADDLHDRIGGRLFTLQQGIDQCLQAPGTSPELNTRLVPLAKEARACADDVRTLMNELRPTVLDELGLAETLSEYVANISEIISFRIKLEIHPDLYSWRSSQDALLFRLIQEAVLNTRKHANAQELVLNLTVENNHVVLEISDDGVGFDPEKIPAGHYGLLTMRERAEALGGTLLIKSRPHAGTSVTVSLPR